MAHFNLGWLQLVSAPKKAEAHFLAAAQLVPDKGGVYLGLGLARLNQGRREAAAYALALECANEPLFLASPWWRTPELAALRPRARDHFTAILAQAAGPASGNFSAWRRLQAEHLAALAPRLGEVSAGPENAYRRLRLGYPVLMRDQDLPPVEDLYVVREDPRFPASVKFALPSKGWMRSPDLLNLLAASPP